MTKRLMTLLVVSSVFCSGAQAAIKADTQAPANIQDVAKRTFGDLYTVVSRAGNDLCTSVTQALGDVEVLAQQAAQKIGSRLNLHVSNTSNSLSVLTIGDGSDVPGLALDGIKKLTQAITPEQAAVLYIKLYKEIIDDVVKTMPDVIREGIEMSENNEDVSALFGKLMQSFMDAVREKTLDLAVMQTALPKDVWLECEAAMLVFAQESAAVFYSELNNAELCWRTERVVLGAFILNWMEEYLNGIVEVVVQTLEQHYTIDRAAFGLENSEDYDLEGSER